jgi:hypothetical protein
MLAPLPARFEATRTELHRLAADVLGPAREKVTGRFGLRALPGGFGTPPFGDVMQVHVDGTDLVIRDGTSVRREPIENVDAEAAGALAAWFAFGTGVLEELRAETPLEHGPTAPQLWPEHFDIAIELGSETEGRRAGFGASPGDEDHPEPYLYVTPWAEDGFVELGYQELLAAQDRREAALAFFRSHRERLLAQ